jgi:AraC-like DNA-binding protein
MDSAPQLHEAPQVERRERRDVPQRGLNPRVLIRVAAHIEGHLGDELTLGIIAGVACVSRFHFARMFRLSTGCSPMEYVLRCRVRRARLELAQGCQGLSDLAAQLGFCDQSHFTRIFRRMTGFTPGRYADRQTLDRAKQYLAPGENTHSEHWLADRS